MDVTLTTDGGSIAKPLCNGRHGGYHLLLGLSGLVHGLFSQGLHGFNRREPGTKVLSREGSSCSLAKILIDIDRIDPVSLSLLVNPLKQLLTWDIRAAAHDTGKRGIV